MKYITENRFLCLMAGCDDNTEHHLVGIQNKLYTAGQAVPHFRIHIIPRRKNDGYGGTGEWPDFKGANRKIEIMHQMLRMKQPE